MEKKNKGRTEIINSSITLGQHQKGLEWDCNLLHDFIHRLIWDVREVCGDFYWREWAVDWLMDTDRSSGAAEKMRVNIDSIEVTDNPAERIWARSVKQAAVNVCRAAYWVAIAIEREQTFALLQAIRFGNSAREDLALAVG